MALKKYTVEAGLTIQQTFLAIFQKLNPLLAGQGTKEEYERNLR
jgi:hypothetical protein